jgi:SET domain-containing protein
MRPLPQFLPDLLPIGKLFYLAAIFSLPNSCMALFDKHLYVKKSSIPNSGKGLFTKKTIPKGARIVEYKGVISSWKDVKDEDGKNGYIFFVNRKHVINALPTLKALARYANDANGLTRVKGLTNNAEYETEGTKAYILAKREIPAKSEIFVDYGNDYWKVIRTNIKLWEREAKRAAEKLERQKAREEAKAKKAAKAGKSATKKSAARKSTTKKAAPAKKKQAAKKRG